MARHTCRGGGRAAVVHAFGPMHWKKTLDVRHPSSAELSAKNDCASEGGSGEIQLRWDRYGAQKEAAEAFADYVMFVDTTDAMAMRADGHPANSKGHAKGLDCMHWVSDRDEN